jgi:uncharacterized lipoprotein YmbA
MSHRNWILCLSLALLVSACGSTPRSNYYMLSAETGGALGSGGPSLGIGPVTVPEYLQRREMVLNRSSNQLQLADYDRWAEPLDAGILRVISLNLARTLNTQRLQSYPWRRDYHPDYSVSVAVVQFAMQDRNAELVAEWTVKGPAGTTTVTRQISQLSTLAADNEPGSVAAAYSELLAQLAGKIAAVISTQTN